MSSIPETLIGRARELVPGFRARAEATEAARRIPDETIKELRDSELLRVLQPKRYGGFECDLDGFARIVIELGRGCGSTTWVYSIIAMQAWQLGMFPGAAQDEIWRDDLDVVVCSSYAPTGMAAPEADGYRLSGTWNFASGCDSATWAVLGARIPEPAFVLVPRADWEIEDNWHVLGLAGTGSKNVVVADAFAPRHRVLTVQEALTSAPPGIAVNDAAIYRIPFFSTIGTCLCMPPVSIAGGALDAYLAATRARVTRGASLGGGKQMAELPTIQLRVAEAAAMLDAARLLVLRDLADTQTTVAAGIELTPEQRLRNRRDHGFAARLSQQAVDRLFESAGAASLFTDSPFQRAWRDVHACAKHISLNWDAVGTLYGRHALGVPLEGAQF